MDRSARLRLVSAAILIVGLVSAIVIYYGAVQAPADPLGDPEDSKKYLHDMELYGGKANLLATEARDWLHGLWHGRRLAFTVAVLAGLAAAGFRLAAIPLPPLDDEPDDGGGSDASGEGGEGGGEPRGGAGAG
jgi:hypothetical protein